MFGEAEQALEHAAAAVRRSRLPPGPAALTAFIQGSSLHRAPDRLRCVDFHGIFGRDLEGRYLQSSAISGRSHYVRSRRALGGASRRSLPQRRSRESDRDAAQAAANAAAAQQAAAQVRSLFEVLFTLTIV